MSTPILHVLKELLQKDVVMVRSNHVSSEDVLWSRNTVLDYAMRVGDFLKPVSSEQPWPLPIET
jgi:hypothetical protein